MDFMIIITYIGVVLRYGLIVLAILACIKYLRTKTPQ